MKREELFFLCVVHAPHEPLWPFDVLGIEPDPPAEFVPEETYSWMVEQVRQGLLQGPIERIGNLAEINAARHRNNVRRLTQWRFEWARAVTEAGVFLSHVPMERAP